MANGPNDDGGTADDPPDETTPANTDSGRDEGGDLETEGDVDAEVEPEIDSVVEPERDDDAGPTAQDAESPAVEEDGASTQATTADGLQGGESQTKGPDEKFCGSCGEIIKQEAEICPNCGVRVKGSSATGSGENDPAIVALISFLVPGAGQIMLGQTTRGVSILVGYLLFWVITFVLMFVLIGFLLVLLAPVFNIGAAWDAYNQAQKINAGEIEV